MSDDKSGALALLESEFDSKFESGLALMLCQTMDPSAQFTAPYPSYVFNPRFDVPDLDFNDDGSTAEPKENFKFCITDVPSRYICIYSGGLDSVTEELPAFIWVAVHGINSICVATRTKDLELEFNIRKTIFREEPAISLPIITNGIIGKVEDLVDRSKLPFGVVSLFPGTKTVPLGNGLEGVCDKYDDENAIKFLQDEIESGAVFTYNKTVQTAVCALNHLFHNELKASEIQSFVWKEKDGDQPKALTLLDRHRGVFSCHEQQSR